MERNETVRDERRGNNRLILRKLATPKKLWSKGDTKHYSVEYLWYSENGGVLGNEFTYWSARESKALLSAESLFDVVNLF